MDEQWYILIGDRKKAGPVPFEKLQELKNKGKIAPNTMIRRVNDPKWVAAALVSGLFGTLLSESNASLPILNNFHDSQGNGYDYPSEITEAQEDSSETAFIQSPESVQADAASGYEQEQGELPLFNIKVAPRSSRGAKLKKTSQAAAIPADGRKNGSDEPAVGEVSSPDYDDPVSNQEDRTRSKGGSRYPALLTISFLLKIQAIVYLVFGVLTAIGMFLGGLLGGTSVAGGFGGGGLLGSGIAGGGLLMGIISGVICLCGSLVAALLLWAIAELIRLLMDIEENTRA